MSQVQTVEAPEFFSASTVIQIDDSNKKSPSDVFLFTAGSSKTVQYSLTVHFWETSSITHTVVDSDSTIDIYSVKEKEWEDLVGKKDFQSLNKQTRDFLVNAAGMIDLGFSIDIKKAYRYSPYEDED